MRIVRSLADVSARREWMRTPQLPIARRLVPQVGMITFVLSTFLLAACAGPSTIGEAPSTGATGTCAGNNSVSGPSSSGDLGAPPSNGGAPIGQVPTDQQIHLNISFAINQAALEKCVEAVNDPTSSDYHHFLSPQDIAAHFAPKSADIANLKSFLTSNGLTVGQSYDTNAALSVDGTAAQIEKAFSLTLNQYQKGDRTVYAPDKAATLPSNVQNIVESITGLSNYSAVHCNVSGGNQKCGFISNYAHFTKPTTAAVKPAKLADNTGDCTLATIGIPMSLPPPTLLTWTSLRSAYGLNNLAASGFDGADTSIGMVEFDSYDPNDVRNYALCAGTNDPAHPLDTHIQDVVVVPGGAAPSAVGTAGAGEATLDMEMALGVAGANAATTHKYPHIINYYAPNDAQWESSLQDILHRAASDKKVKVLSISYGDFEEDMTPTYMAAVNDTMKLLASEGISVFVASGDCAAFGSGQYGTKALSFPASAPWAIAVGGTQLTTDLLGARQDETVWGAAPADPKAACQNTWGTGGGLSSVSSFTLPKWQKGTGVSNQFSNGERQVPDVSAAAINISFYYSGLWLGVGGTSAAAPIWATGTAIVNQALAAKGKSPVGAVPNLYSLATGSNGSKTFIDITKGTNIGFNATKGWDYATGWGSPQFDQIAAALGA